MRSHINIQRIQKHPVIFSVIVFQIMFLAVLTVSACITPRRVISVNMSSFVFSAENISVRDGTLMFSEHESVDDKSRQNITTEEMGISSGAYKVDIFYDSEVNGNRINENNASVSISSQWRVSFDTVTLDDQHRIVSGKLWVPFFSGCDDLKIGVSYNGKGTLGISEIRLTEALRYRAMRIIGFLGFFALCDLAIIVFFSSVKLDIKKEHIALTLIAAVASLPFCARVLFNGHDLNFHLLRIVSLAEELENGQFPVRMATELNNGYGYPTPIYYCDIFLYLSAVLYRQSVPLRMCYQIYAVLVNAATTIFTYLSIGKVTERTSIRLTGTGLYVLCSYRLANINVRAAVGEYTAMAFLPLIMAGIYLIYTKEKPLFKDWIYLCAGMAGVIMSHVLTAEMIAINMILLCLVLIKKTLKKEVFAALVKAAVLCFGVTAWFLIPFLDYFISHTTLVQNSDLRFLEGNTQELIYLFQLFSPGKSVGHYLTIGLPLILGAALILYCLANYAGNEYQQGAELRVVSGFAFLNIAFVSRYFPWGRIQRHLGTEGLGYQIGTIQFSWRFLSIASVILVFAVVIALNGMEQKNVRRFQAASAVLAASMILSAGVFYFKYADEAASGAYNRLQPYSNSDSLYLLDETDRSVQNSAVPKTLQGEVVISDYSRTKGVFHMYLKNENDFDAVVSAPVYNYKYFNAYDDKGKRMEEASGENNCFALKIPAYFNGRVEIRFEPPFIWKVSEWVSLVCVFMIIGKLIFMVKRRRSSV